jgi:hypothetical protein
VDIDDEIKSEEITKPTIDNEYYDDSKVKENEENFKQLNQDLNNANGAKTLGEEGEIVYENKKIKNGFEALAHLDRAYERVREGNTVKYINIGNELNPDAPLELLNPDKYL